MPSYNPLGSTKQATASTSPQRCAAAHRWPSMVRTSRIRAASHTCVCFHRVKKDAERESVCVCVTQEQHCLAV